MEKTKYKIVYLHKKILFPHGTLQLHAHSSKKSVLIPGENIIVFPIRNPLDSFFYKNRVITIAKVTHQLKATGLPMVEVKGLGRAYIHTRDTFNSGTYQRIELQPLHNSEYMTDTIRKMAQEFVFLIDIPESERLIYLMNFITEPQELIDFISHYFISTFKTKWVLFNQLHSNKRAEFLIQILTIQIDTVRKKLERQ